MSEERQVLQARAAGVHASANGAEVATPVSLVEWFLNFYAAAQEGDVKPVEGIVRAGEVLFVPRGWWHLAINLEVLPGHVLPVHVVPGHYGIDLSLPGGISAPRAMLTESWLGLSYLAFSCSIRRVQAEGMEERPLHRRVMHV